MYKPTYFLTRFWFHIYRNSSRSGRFTFKKILIILQKLFLSGTEMSNTWVSHYFYISQEETWLLMSSEFILDDELVPM